MVDMQTHFFSGGQDLAEYLDHNEKPSLVKFLMEPNALETVNEQIFQMLTSFFPCVHSVTYPLMISEPNMEYLIWSTRKLDMSFTGFMVAVTHFSLLPYLIFLRFNLWPE